MELINAQLIQIDAELRNKNEVFENVCNLLEAEGRLQDRQLFLQDLVQREEAGPTAPGYSFALPHAKSKGVKHASLVFIHLRDELEWTESEKVKYIFAIAVPEQEAGDRHLQILSKLARNMMREEFREALAKAKTKEEYLTLLTEIDD